MNNNEQYYYNKGIVEGYFDVRLENILDQDLDTRKTFLLGYKEGKMKRNRLAYEELNKYEDNRIGYIKQIGYLVGYNDYPASSSALKEEDIEIFNLGLNAGIAQKEKLNNTNNQKVKKLK